MHYVLSRRRATHPAHHVVQVGHALSEVRVGQKKRSGKNNTARRGPKAHLDLA